MEVILNSWMFSTEFAIIFAALYIGLLIWMGKDFKIPRPKKGDEWIVVTIIKRMFKK